LYKNCQRQSFSAINCLSSGINILATIGLHQRYRQSGQIMVRNVIIITAIIIHNTHQFSREKQSVASWLNENTGQQKSVRCKRQLNCNQVSSVIVRIAANCSSIGYMSSDALLFASGNSQNNANLLCNYNFQLHASTVDEQQFAVLFSLSFSSSHH